MSVNMQESRAARFATVCALYFAQGVPWFFVATALVTFLVDNGSMDDDRDEVEDTLTNHKPKNELLGINFNPAFCKINQ